MIIDRFIERCIRRIHCWPIYAKRYRKAFVGSVLCMRVSNASKKYAIVVGMVRGKMNKLLHVEIVLALFLTKMSR